MIAFWMMTGLAAALAALLVLSGARRGADPAAGAETQAGSREIEELDRLKARGLLDDTLVVWGGEFGRTVYCQGKLTRDQYGRDHHPRCFTIWMAGGGSKPGTVYGSTDDFSYNIAENPVSVHDLQATLLHLLGIDHEKLTYLFEGRLRRLTDVGGQNNLAERLVRG
jgi:hypothetical protein